MKRSAIVLGAAGLLSACSAAQVSTTVSDAQQACVTVAPVLAAGAASSNATAQSVASFGNAVCGPLAGGSVPATVDASTPTWLGSLAGMLQVILPVAAALI